MKENDMARVQCLYERAIVENCLNAEFWTEYTNHLVRKLNISNCNNVIKLLIQLEHSVFLIKSLSLSQCGKMFCRKDLALGNYVNK